VKSVQYYSTRNTQADLAQNTLHSPVQNKENRTVQQETKDNIIEKEINKIDENLEFKMTTEDNNIIHYLDLTLKRNSNNTELSIYRKPTNTDTTIHYQSNHPYEHKMLPLDII